MATGFVAGLRLPWHLSQREGLEKDKIYNLGIYLALAGIVGAKLFLLFQDRYYYWQNPGADLFFFNFAVRRIFMAGCSWPSS